MAMQKLGIPNSNFDESWRVGGIVIPELKFAQLD